MPLQIILRHARQLRTQVGREFGARWRREQRGGIEQLVEQGRIARQQLRHPRAGRAEVDQAFQRFRIFAEQHEIG